MRQLPLAVLSLVAVAAPLYAADAPKTWEGLEQRPVKGLDLVYVRPGAQLQGYKSILIDTPVEVAFDRHWDPNEGVRSTTRRMSASDIQAIKTEMAAEFHKVFAEELAKGGYALVDQVRDDTLRLHAQIADVFINAPDRMEPGRVTSYTMESGRATLERDRPAAGPRRRREDGTAQRHAAGHQLGHELGRLPSGRAQLGASPREGTRLAERQAVIPGGRLTPARSKRPSRRAPYTASG